MVSRSLIPLRGLLPAFVLILACTSLAIPVAQARNPYDYTDQTEGDPGDGVLNPVAPTKESGDQAPDPVGTDNLLPWPTGVRFIPIGIGSGQPGWGIWLILPNEWSRTPAFSFLSQGRERHAP